MVMFSFNLFSSFVFAISIYVIECDHYFQQYYGTVTSEFSSGSVTLDLYYYHDYAGYYALLDMGGPVNSWFGVGFNDEMNGAYAIVVDGDDMIATVDEYTLNKPAGGTMLNGTIELYSQLYNESNMLMVTCTRPTTSDLHTLTVEASTIPIITAYGNNAWQSYHTAREGSVFFYIFYVYNLLKTLYFLFNPRTVTSITMMEMDMVHEYGLFNGYSTVTLPCGTVSVMNMLYSDIRDMFVYIVITGPSDRWFGIGYDNTVMLDTYSIVIDSSGASELLLKLSATAFTAGPFTALSGMNGVTVVSDTTESGVRTVVLKRLADTEQENYYVFENSTSTINMIFACGSSDTSTSLWYHGASNKGTSTMMIEMSESTHSPTNEPTMGPSMEPSMEPTMNPSMEPTMGTMMDTTMEVVDSVDMKYYTLVSIIFVIAVAFSMQIF